MATIKFTSLMESTHVHRPQLPNESLTIIDSRINSATGSSQDMSQCTVDKMEKYGIP